MPTTATSAIAGWSASTASTSPGATVSPPVRSTSRRAADDREVALVVEHPEVARVVPALAQRRRGRLGVARSSRPSGTRSCRQTSPSSVSRSETPGCGMPTEPGLRARSACGEDGARPGLGRPVVDAGARRRERVTQRRDELGRCRRRPGVDLAEARQVVAAIAVLEDPRPDRGDAVEPGRARGARPCAGSVSASGEVARCSGQRACQAPSAIDHPAMWNSGNMQTVAAVPSGAMRLGKLRRQLTRCERTTPFGSPGAAAREEDDVRVVFVEPGRVDVVGARGRGGGRERRVGDHGDVPTLGECGVRVVDDEQARARVGDHLGGLRAHRVGRSPARRRRRAWRPRRTSA